MIHKRFLDNGIRVLGEKIPHVNSVSIGLWVNIGSRDEERGEHGISHFLEHMFFKGTEHRSAKQIALEIDAIGGELNAFTTREMTTFYAKVLDEHLPKAIDLLSDIFLSSQFYPKEIEREKQVVLEEIKMVEDDPEDLVHDLHLKEIWKGHFLARPILGTPKTVSNMTKGKILRFIERTYDPEEIIIAVAGCFDFSPLMKLLQASFGKYAANGTNIHARRPPKIRPIVQAKQKDFEQVHLCIGAQGLSNGDPERYVLYILNTILGGGMSSRLFQEIRERHGWAYSIYSSPSSFQDGGLFTIYAGTSAENVHNVVNVILRGFKKMKEEPVALEDLERAKNHIKGGMMLSMESTSNRMCRLAKEELYFGRHLSLRKVLSMINKVTTPQVEHLANKLFQEKYLTMTALGKVAADNLPEKLSL
ncbi:MAG: M16 family metallopeptidase [Nitrospiria bacterium]